MIMPVRKFNTACLYCKKIFQIVPSLAKKGEGKFCSISCGVSFRNKKSAIPAAENFYRNILDNSDKNKCWIYKNTGKKGYGRLTIDKKDHRAHRFSYEHHIGPIPDGMIICHKCDNPPCVNPDHLFLGTSKDNRQDMLKKGRGNFAKGAKLPHSKLSEDEVLIIKSKLNQGISASFLALEYKVNRTTIAQIKRNKNWKWIVWPAV